MDQNLVETIVDIDPRSGPVTLYLASLDRETSRSTMRIALDTIARMLGADLDAFSAPWHKLTPHACAMLRQKMSEMHAPATVNRKLAALRQVIDRCEELGLMTAQDAKNCARELKGVRGSREQAGRTLTRAEIEALFSACQADFTPAGARDFAILSLLRHTGMRREEVSSLTTDELDIDGAQVRIIGKGNKERIIPLNAPALDALRQWLSVRGDLTTGRVFARTNKSGKILDAGFTPQVIDLILDRRADQAGVAALGAHDLRRTFATDLDKRGQTLPTIQELMGHSSPRTTKMYIRVDDEQKRQAVDSLAEVKNG